jgi:hypothetical protein
MKESSEVLLDSIGLVGILTVVFMTLKLCHMIAWWWGILLILLVVLAILVITYLLKP